MQSHTCGGEDRSDASENLRRHDDQLTAVTFEELARLQAHQNGAYATRRTPHTTQASTQEEEETTEERDESAFRRGGKSMSPQTSITLANTCLLTTAYHGVVDRRLLDYPVLDDLRDVVLVTIRHEEHALHQRAVVDQKRVDELHLGRSITTARKHGCACVWQTHRARI
jgi:hypothetical protein